MKHINPYMHYGNSAFHRGLRKYLILSFDFVFYHTESSVVFLKYCMVRKQNLVNSLIQKRRVDGALLKPL